jgi:hypothetical protein
MTFLNHHPAVRAHHVLMPLNPLPALAYSRPVAAHQRYGFDSPDNRRIRRPLSGIFLSVKHDALSMGATCGKPSGLPEPVTGLSTHTFAPTPFDSGRRDSKRFNRNHPMKTIPHGATASFRLSVYNFLRTFTGPALAFRLASFVRGAA